jgi:hypothetical protein
MKNFGTLRQFLNLPPLSPQICHSAGGRGVPDFFLLLRIPCKNLKPCDNPFWDFSNGGESKKINTKNSGLHKLLHWSHALRLDQNAVNSGHLVP